MKTTPSDPSTTMFFPVVEIDPGPPLVPETLQSLPVSFSTPTRFGSSLQEKYKPSVRRYPVRVDSEGRTVLKGVYMGPSGPFTSYLSSPNPDEPLRPY